MTFLLTPALFGLLLLPVLVLGYVKLSQRRNSRTAALSAQGFTPTEATLRLRKRRHIPFIFFFVGLTVLLFALARPATSLSLRSREGTVILAFDVSNSMRATDLKPTRMAAAKSAAKGFVEKQPSGIKIGVVAFNDGGIVTQQPTLDKRQVLAAVDRLTPSGGTSLGDGIFASLGAIAGKAIAVDPSKLADGPDGPQVDIGYFGSSAILLLSDGENTGELSPADVAKLASVAGVHIYTIGIGSPEGTVVEIDGFSVSTALNEQSLTEIAKVSDGKYFAADSASSLASVYRSIDLQWKSVRKNREITGLLTAVSSGVLLIGAALSLAWFGRVV